MRWEVGDQNRLVPSGHFTLLLCSDPNVKQAEGSGRQVSGSNVSSCLQTELSGPFLEVTVWGWKA